MPKHEADGRAAGDRSEGFLARVQKFALRHRKIVFPLAAVVGVIAASLIAPGDLKWPLGMLVGVYVSYAAAKQRAANQGYGGGDRDERD